MEKPIFLIGFMSVGKTTVGKKLAKKLNVPFYDTDEEIEKQTDKSVRQLFSEHGETHFRNLEKKWLEQFTNTSAVVATGGGLPCFFDNMDQLNRKGVTVYLHRPAKEIFQRLNNAKKKRPLVEELNENELLAYIETTLGKRNMFYEKAQITVGRNEQTPEDIIRYVLK